MWASRMSPSGRLSRGQVGHMTHITIEIGMLQSQPREVDRPIAIDEFVQHAAPCGRCSLWVGLAQSSASANSECLLPPEVLHCPNVSLGFSKRQPPLGQHDPRAGCAKRLEQLCWRARRNYQRRKLNQRSYDKGRAVLSISLDASTPVSAAQACNARFTPASSWSPVLSPISECTPVTPMK